jgi:hypothetical protein
VKRYYKTFGSQCVASGLIPLSLWPLKKNMGRKAFFLKSKAVFPYFILE